MKAAPSSTTMSGDAAGGDDGGDLVVVGEARQGGDVPVMATPLRVSPTGGSSTRGAAVATTGTSDSRLSAFSVARFGGPAVESSVTRPWGERWNR
jgi:hypothetical protein